MMGCLDLLGLITMRPPTCSGLFHAPLAIVSVAVSIAMFVPAPAAAQGTSARAAQFYEDALRRESAKDLAGAIVQLKNALKLDNRNLAVHLKLGRLLLQSGELKAAEASLEEALRLGVDLSEVGPSLGQVYLLQGNTQKLLDTLNPVAVTPAVRAEVLTLRGSAYVINGGLTQASQSFAEARQLDPNSALPDIAEVPLLLRAGDVPKARQLALRATERAPRSVTAWFQYGTLLFSQGELPAALAAFDKTLSLDDRHVDSRVSKASILLAQGRKVEAVAELKALKDGKAREPRASFLRGMLADERGDAVTAQKEFQEAAELVDSMSPNIRAMNEPVLFAGALSHRELGNREKTRQYLESILGRNSRSMAATMLLAEELLQSNELGRAAPLIDSVLRQNPDDPTALAMKGRIHLSRRQYDQAAEALERASQKPVGSGSLRDLSYSLFALGQERKAVQSLEKAYAANRKDSYTAMELAVYHARRGDSKRAIQVAEELVSREPENLAMLNFLGNIKGRLQDRKGMKEAYEKALAKNPKFKPVVQNLSWFDMQEGRLDQARARLRAFLKDAPNDADVLYQAGVLEYSAGRTTEAAGIWTQADNLQPKDPRSLLALMDLHLREGQLDPALAAARTLQGRFPDSAQALAAVARTHTARKEPALARQVLQDAVKAAGFNSEVLVSLSRQLAQIGALDDAGHAANKALQASVDDPQALALKVEIGARQGQPAEVDKALTALQAKHPNLPITLVTAGHVAFAREQYPRAVSLYKQVFDREPTTQLALNLAQAYAATKQADKGVELLKNWSARSPRDLTAQRALADMLMFAGRNDEAKQAYAAIVKAHPNDANLLAAQAMLLARLGDPGALPVLERAYKMMPSNSLIADGYGWMLLRSGNTAGAVTVLREARLRDPANPVVRWHLAAALHRAGKAAEARDELRAALATKPPPPSDPELDLLTKALGL